MTPSRHTRWSLLLALLGASAWGAPSPARADVGGVAVPSASALHYRHAYPPTLGVGPHSDMKIVTDADGVFSFAQTPVGGFTPADLQAAYGLPSGGGDNRLVAIFAGGSDYTNAESDLAVYRAQFGLPPCTSASGCFRKVDENGGTNLPAAGTDEGEQALDMEMVSAACPRCRIMLIEGNDLGSVRKTAVAAGAVALSFSILLGFNVGPAGPCKDGGYDAVDGLLVTAATGDSGYPGARDFVPTACQGTVAVGGTSLTKASNARGFTETAWSGAGSGCTPSVTKPTWQTDTGCSTRMESDVSAVADPGTGVAFYCTMGPSGWGVVGGTSVAAPFMAGSLTNLGVANGHFTPAWIWKNTSTFFDVTSGSTGACSGGPSYFCTAGAAYDGPTGWGTVNGAAIAASLAASTTTPVVGGCGAVPSGTYAGSCSGCAVGKQGSRCVLTCDSCTEGDGITAGPSVSLPLPCAGVIANASGVLACEGGTAVDGGTAPAPDASSSPLSSGLDAGARGKAMSSAATPRASVDFTPAASCALVLAGGGMEGGPRPGLILVGLGAVLALGTRRRRG